MNFFHILSHFFYIGIDKSTSTPTPVLRQMLTRKQQDIIDESISSYIKNYDKVAQQYLKLRQEVYTTLQLIEANEESKIQVAKLRYEADRVCAGYALHLDRLKLNLDAKSAISPSYVEELESQYLILNEKKKTLTADIKDLKENQKPLLDQVKVLTTNFAQGVSGKTAKRKNIHELTSDDTRKTIDVVSSVFSYDELRELFTDLNESLKELKTVDGEERRGFDIIEYLDSHVKDNRAFRKVDDKYLYDIANKTIMDAGSGSSSIDDIDKTIAGLSSNLKDLIEHGTEAKERWSLNARKLDRAREALNDEMEVDT